jgi:hypothetical protein
LFTFGGADGHAIVGGRDFWRGRHTCGTVSYFLTKLKERESEWRKQKLEYYREFLTAVSGTVQGDSNPDAQRRFATACNVIGLVASQDVIHNLHRFQEVTKANSGASLKDHDDILKHLLLSIRRDLQISPKDNPETFSYRLWASGAGPK